MSVSWTREGLDRQAIENDGRIVFTCSTHPGLPTTAIYQDGDLRLLCPACGFEVGRIKVAAQLDELTAAARDVLAQRYNHPDIPVDLRRLADVLGED